MFRWEVTSILSASAESAFAGDAQAEALAHLSASVNNLLTIINNLVQLLTIY